MNELASARPHERGFSLLEVLVAFSILAISLGILLSLFSTGLRNLSVSRDYSRALIIAESKLAEIAVEQPLESNGRAGAFDDKYRWTVEISEHGTPPMDSPPGGSARLYLITVTVTWGKQPDEAAPRRVVLNDLRFSHG